MSSIAACSNAKNTNDSAEQERYTYKSWVLSRCLASIAKNEEDKADALNTASVYLEASRLSIEDFTDAKPLIEKYITKNYQGSIPGTFNTKKCIELLYSRELEQLFVEKQKKLLHK